jgi:DNA repair protein RadC
MRAHADCGGCLEISDSIFRDLDADKEHFVLLAVNNKNRVNGFKLISTGTLTSALVRPGDVPAATQHKRS